MPIEPRSASEVLSKVYDSENDTLRTSTTSVTIDNISLDVQLDATDGDSVRISDGTDTMLVNADGSINVSPVGTWNIEIDAADGDSIKVSDGTDDLAINADGSLNAAQSGTWNINNVSGTISLPTDAATETTLSTLNGKVPSNLTVSSTRLLVDGSGVTQPVSGPLTDAQLRASEVPVQQPNEFVTGTHATGSETTIEFDTSSGINTIVIEVLGTFEGTVFFEGQINSAWTGISVCNLLALDGQVPTDTSAPGYYMANTTGLKKFRTRCSPVSGTVEVAIGGGTGHGVTAQIQSYTFIKQSDGDSIQTRDFALASRIDEASATVTYIGKADIGSLNASAVWRISRLTVSGTVTTIEYADGDSAYDNVWDDRASLSYS